MWRCLKKQGDAGGKEPGGGKQRGKNGYVRWDWSILAQAQRINNKRVKRPRKDGSAEDGGGDVGEGDAKES